MPSHFGVCSYDYGWIRARNTHLPQVPVLILNTRSYRKGQEENDSHLRSPVLHWNSPSWERHAHLERWDYIGIITNSCRMLRSLCYLCRNQMLLSPTLHLQSTIFSSFSWCNVNLIKEWCFLFPSWLWTLSWPNNLTISSQKGSPWN